MEYLECHWTAARILAGDTPVVPALVHPELLACLTRCDALCRHVEGRLVSRQIISVIVFLWIDDNPDKPPYLVERKHGQSGTAA